MSAELVAPAILALVVGFVLGQYQSLPDLLSLDAIKPWQTLITGVLAVVAATATVGLLSRQVNEQRQQFESRREDRLRACPAILPADLSAITDYCKESSHVIRKGLTKEPGPTTHSFSEQRLLECPTLPERVLSNLQNLIEQLDEKQGELVAELIRCYQVQHSRLRGTVANYNEPTRSGQRLLIHQGNWDFTTGETVKLYHLACRMFAYARCEVSRVEKPEWLESFVRNSIRNLGLSDVLSEAYQDQLVELYAEDADDEKEMAPQERGLV